MSENVRKQALIYLMRDLPLQTLQIAYLFAKNYSEYGEDVTKTWVTATQNASALEKAYRKGYYDGLKNKVESEDEQTMLIEFTKDFANNWKAGDIVKAKYLEKGEVLVDDVAKIDIELLLEHCRVIQESKDTYKTYTE